MKTVYTKWMLLLTFAIAANGVQAQTSLSASHPAQPRLANGTNGTSCTDDGDDWMRRLPDDTFVAKVSIPGAHDSATGDGFESSFADMGDSFARTQELSINEQWNIGIRAFDLRPASYEGYLHTHHGIIPTSRRFDDILYQLRDSLKAHPSEFVVIHMLHAKDGDQNDNYNSQITALLKSDELKDYLVDFKRDLRVKDVRGKILILSRDKYATTPIGGFFESWTGSADWGAMTSVKIVGSNNVKAPCYVQDFSETYANGALQTKQNAIKQLLRYSMAYKNDKSYNTIWFFNFASAYSKVVSLFGSNISTSDGYRDNATYTHATIIDYLNTAAKAGPTGVMLMDYVGVDQTGEYKTLGREVVKTIIANNFKYLTDKVEEELSVQTPKDEAQILDIHNLNGMRLVEPQQGSINIIRYTDGTTRKTI